MHPARTTVTEVTPGYEHYQPENTLLYQIIDQYYPLFLTHLEQQGRTLPAYVQKEFEDYLKSAADWNTAFYGCVARTATMSD